MNNPETQTTLGTRQCVTKEALENTEGAIKYEQSRKLTTWSKQDKEKQNKFHLAQANANNVKKRDPSYKQLDVKTRLNYYSCHKRN